MPANKYHRKDGGVVPSVTTILGRSKDSGGLIHWAWKEGAAGRDYRQTRDTAANVGTETHEAIEQWLIDGRDPILLSSEATTAFTAFRDWYDSEDLTKIAAEVKLVSEEHGYGGQFDLLATMPGRGVVVCDWKTSTKVYPEMVAQLAAYAELVRENGVEYEELAPKGVEIGGGVVLRLDKKTGTPEPHFYTPEQLQAGWAYFLSAMDLYHADKSLKKSLRD